MITFTTRWSRLRSRRRPWRARLAAYRQSPAASFPWRPLALVHRRPGPLAVRATGRGTPSPEPARAVHVATHVTEERWQILPGTRLERVISRVQQIDLHVSHRPFVLARDERRTFNTTTNPRASSTRHAIAPPAPPRQSAPPDSALRPSVARAERLVQHSEHVVRSSFQRHLVTAGPYGRRDALEATSVAAPLSAGASVSIPVGLVVRDLPVSAVPRRLAKRAASSPDARHDNPARRFGAGPPPVPMVMRRSPDEARQTEAAPIAVGARAVAGGAAAAAAPAEPAQTRAAAWPHVAAPDRQLTLDGAAIDRLAEDVMSRLDRRLRIERERRGL